MSENKRVLGSDFAKIDAHVIQPEEYEEIPEITEEMFARGEWSMNGAPVRRGRPKSDSPKEMTTLRLDPEVLAYFKASGSGWQTRINDALRKVAGL